MENVVAAGRWYPDGSAGLVILLVALAALAAMILYGRSKGRRGK